MPNESNHHSVETLVLGAGYAGLTAAALLADSGQECLVLESHSTLGGCAGFYREGAFTFDVGATTLTGFADGHPADRVFRHLGINVPTIRVDPGQVMRMQSGDIVRHADSEQWIDEVSSRFTVGDQPGFWNRVNDLNTRAWEIIGSRTKVPPASRSDWWNLITSATLHESALLPGLLRPMKSLMQRYGVDADPEFVGFVNEQLMISTQSTSEKAPYLIGALGLAYPGETYYPVGGMMAPALQLMRHLQLRNGAVKFRRRVTSVVQQRDQRWKVTCDNGEVYVARRVISSIPIWNMTELTEGATAKHYRKQSRRFHFGWGAVTAYLAVEGTPEVQSPYTQVHLDQQIDGVSSGSLFVSVSHPKDTVKAPAGSASVTVSAHTHPRDWMGLDGRTHAEKKRRVLDQILDHIRRRVPEVGDLENHHVEGGTPQTWDHYTSRFEGRVGGIPHTTSTPIFLMPGNVTPFEGLYQIGDTAFPGQGVPAVMTGAWNTVQRILAEETP